MWIIRMIRNHFRVKRSVASLKEQAERMDCWRDYVKEEHLYSHFEYYSKALNNIWKKASEANIEVKFIPVLVRNTKKINLAPKLYVSQDLDCCKKLKMISSLWKKDGVQYSVIKGSEVLISGEGNIKDCIKEIKGYLKNGGNGKV